MALSGPAVALLVATALVYGLVALWFWRGAGTPRTRGSAAQGAAGYDALADADRVEPGECRECGAENDPQFTFCRACCAPLPAARTGTGE